MLSNQTNQPNQHKHHHRDDNINHNHNRLLSLLVSSSSLLPPPSYYFVTNNNDHPSTKSLATYYQQYLLQSNNTTNNIDNNIDDEWDYAHGEIIFGLAYWNMSSSMIERLNEIDHDNDDGSSPSSSSSSSYSWLAGCTRFGEICIWIIPSVKRMDHKNDDNDEDDMYDYRRDDQNKKRRRRPSQPRTLPLWKYQVTKGSLYDCQFMVKQQQPPEAVTKTDMEEECWLMICGDGGVYAFDWDRVIIPILLTKLENYQQQQQQRHRMIDEESMMIIPKYTLYPTYPSFYEAKSIEINQCCYIQNHILYGAAGDTLCYKWDMNTQQVVTTYRHYHKGGGTASGYLHTVQHVPSTNILLTGGEDGVLFLWDISHDTLIESIPINQHLLQSLSSTSSLSSSQLEQQQSRQPTTAAAAASTLPSHEVSTTSSSSSSHDTTKSKHNNPERQRQRDCWISSCTIYDTNWCSIAGGCYHSDNSNNNHDNHNHGGFITTFHIPTRTFVSGISTKETISKIVYDHSSVNKSINQHGANTTASSTSCTNHLLSISNESYITHWKDPFQLVVSYHDDNHDEKNYNNNKQRLSSMIQKVKCTTPSGYGLAIHHPDDGQHQPQIAVSGIGPIVDIYHHSTQLSYRVTTR